MEMPLGSQQLSRGKQVSVSSPVIPACCLSLWAQNPPTKTTHMRSEGWKGGNG